MFNLLLDTAQLGIVILSYHFTISQLPDGVKMGTIMSSSGSTIMTLFFVLIFLPSMITEPSTIV